MRTLDASSIIYAWDNYPIGKFPKLWQWLAREIDKKNLSIPQVALEEVKQKLPECGGWLNDVAIAKINVNNAILFEASQIIGVLGIKDDNYHPDGVSENDVLIIATAKTENLVLVSNESPQVKNPQSNAKLKIPAVCKIPKVGVQCIDFLTLLNQSDETF